MEHFDAIVLGTGGVGSAALMQLAARGQRVLGIDRFGPGHDRGSSHGQTRLIRQAYYEHPDYVPLVLSAFEGWHKLEEAAGETLYHQVGLLQVGPGEGEVLSGVRTSAARHALAIEELNAGEANHRFAGFRLPDDCRAIFETRAGYLLVERCVLAHLRQAERLGARTLSGQAVRSWRADGAGVVVETDSDRYAAGRLVITAGAWAGTLLADLGIQLQVLRKPLFWFGTASDVYRADRGCPAFLFDLPAGCFYGVPQIDSLGIKVAEHTGGAVVDDPLEVKRDVDPVDQRRVTDFTAAHLPQASSERTDHVVCMYTMTADSHFVVDVHPEHPQVVFAAGLSGHGFKFTGVLGRALADLATDGKTELPIGFLSARRESLRRM